MKKGRELVQIMASSYKLVDDVAHKNKTILEALSPFYKDTTVDGKHENTCTHLRSFGTYRLWRRRRWPDLAKRRCNQWQRSNGSRTSIAVNGRAYDFPCKQPSQFDHTATSSIGHNERHCHFCSAICQFDANRYGRHGDEC